MLSQGSQGSGATVDAGDTDGDDRDEDDNVHEAVVAFQASVLNRQDERAGTLGIWVVGVEETIVGGADEKADKCETQDVEESDSPEDLLNGRWKSLDI